MNDYLLLLPPIAFLIIFVFVWLQYAGLKVFSSGEKWPEEKGKTESYACGHEVKDSRVNPNYSQFFPFAFFFTIMHVVALVVATYPRGDAGAVWLGVGYLVSASVSLFILFKR
jgi:NADH-quinone oxidoreductase subunit A